MKSLLLFIVFALIIVLALQNATTSETLSDDIINQTCQTCTVMTPSNISYDFCAASLAALPVSCATNLPGLGLLSLELALQNASNTVLAINSMLSKNESSVDCNSCLQSCKEIYSVIGPKLEECVAEYTSGDNDKVDDVYFWITAIMQATILCERGFEVNGVQSPLTKENYALSQLCGMVLCIVDLISPALKSRSFVST